MERIKRWKKKILDSGRSPGSYSRSRLGHRMVGFARGCLTLSLIGLIGCTTLKKASIVGLAAGAGATVGTVLSGGAIAPILGATTTAFVADVVTSVPITSKGNQIMNECAPDNFWTLLGSLVEMGGWILILIIIIPMIFSWLLPGPIQFKKSGKNG
jgi:hypothetical protein